MKVDKDDQNILRCGGRINNNTINLPYLLQTKYKFTILAVLYTQINQLRGVVNSTITQISQTYWVPRIHKCAKTILCKCVTWRKMRRKAYPKPLLTYGKTEVQKTASSIVTGVDYARTLYVNDHSKIKVCINLFIYLCLDSSHTMIHI